MGGRGGGGGGGSGSGLVMDDFSLSFSTRSDEPSSSHHLKKPLSDAERHDSVSQSVRQSVSQ